MAPIREKTLPQIDVFLLAPWIKTDHFTDIVCSSKIWMYHAKHSRSTQAIQTMNILK